MSVELGRRAWLGATFGAALVGCDRPDRIALRGAGATLPAPLYASWSTRYEALRPAVRIDYAPIGSGGGLRQLALGTIDFGASDVAPDPIESASLGGDPIVAPVAKSALAIATRLPGDPGATPLALDLETLAAIYLGEVTRWDDPVLARQNPDRALPNLPIVPVARSDGGGSTAIFSARLAEAVPRVRAAVGVGRAVVFPAAVGARGSDGVARAVASTLGALGYVEVTHATRAGLSIAAVGASAATASLPTVSAVRDASVSGPVRGYPFASYTFLVVRTALGDARRAAVIAHFAWWILGPGQEAIAPTEGDALASGFQPVPGSLAEKARSELLALKVGGRELIAID